MSNSSEGKILLNILKSLPKRGIWMIRQEGAWGSGEKKKKNRKAYVVINKALWRYQQSSQELKFAAKWLQNRTYTMYLISITLQLSLEVNIDDNLVF